MYIKRKRYLRKQGLITIILSFVIAIVIIILSFFIFKMVNFDKVLLIEGLMMIPLPYDIAFINIIIILTIIMIAPYATIKYLEFRIKQKIEMLIPVFLYDLAGYVRAGYTVPKALEAELGKELGPLKALLEEAVTRITLGEDVTKALEETFKDQTLTTRRFVETIAEAHESGGRAAQVLTESYLHASRLVAFEEERRGNMKVYVSIIYAALLIFMISASFLLFFNTALYEAMESTSSALFITFLTPEQLKGILCYTTLLIAAPSSITAGKIRTGSAVEGLLHMVIMFGIIMLFYNMVDNIVTLLMTMLPL